MPNHLIHETSPYLLQHANNPVDWYPWGDEALDKAVREDKPLLLSIGYSACHWCHVMERESFEDPAVAAIMNEHFVNIKIDREERPDLDHIYMDAVQVMTGSGGWPLNIFLTPSRKPFYGGTYFPPRSVYNRPSWKDVLLGISKAFHTQRDQLEGQSENLTSHIISSNSFGIEAQTSQPDIPSREDMQTLFSNLMKHADTAEGGFGGAPKFPQVFCIQYLLRHYYFTREEAALKQALLSLHKMLAGGIYDQLGGGFARYSTDDRWLVPHFEKMLYDNALLINVLAEAYQLTGDPDLRNGLVQSMQFIKRELVSPEGGFYSALDADSEGVEGKFYVWDKSEIEEVLKEDAPLFCTFYNVSANGNWERKNILHRTIGIEELARLYHLSPEACTLKLEKCRELLLYRRLGRIRPALDDKIILGWNALMISASCKAYEATGEEEFRQLAEGCAAFIWSKMSGEGIYHFYHTYKDGKAKFPAFLDDYAFLISSMIHLQEITGNANYLLNAKELASWVVEEFSDDEGFFYFTHRDQTDVILRKKEIYDGAVPSGNSIMCFNLLFLGIVFDMPEWKNRAQQNCNRISHIVREHPVSFGAWATLFQWLTYGWVELVMTGKDLAKIRKDFLHNFIPNCVYQSATTQNNLFPLLKDKPLTDSTQIFLCKDYSCQSPVTELNELFHLLENVRN